MIADVAFIACSKTKADRPTPAGALYSSPLFRKSLQTAIDSARKIFVLSAEHGVVDLSSVLAPYDTTLKNMNAASRRQWGNRVGRTLDKYAAAKSTIELLCGEEYISPLAADIERLSYKVNNRLSGLSLGQRLSKLAVENNELELKDIKARFDRAINRLWIAQKGGRLLSETSGRLVWPQRGVYFFLDAQMPAANGRMPRVIRVGTHAVSDGSKTSLWDRISTHRGTLVGGGSHRSSIFRLHVGRALVSRTPSLLDQGGSLWGVGQSAPKDVRIDEQHIEAAVSTTLGAMRLLWVDVPDEASSASMRSYIERNAIALLSRIGLLSSHTPQRWLGRYSPEWKIAASGLWNLNHVFAKAEPGFINVFEEAVDYTISQQNLVQNNLDHRSTPQSTLAETQFTLFSQDSKNRASDPEPDRPAPKIPKTNSPLTRAAKKASSGTSVRGGNK